MTKYFLFVAFFALIKETGLVQSSIEESVVEESSLLLGPETQYFSPNQHVGRTHPLDGDFFRVPSKKR